MRYRTYQSFNPSPIFILITVNILLFIATFINREAIILRLGLIPEIWTQQPWTIVTNLFVHAGFGHIIANMITLYFFGTFLSRLVGAGRFFIVYFVGGILGNILYILLGQPFIPAVGASGAVFALGGALAVIVPKLKVFVFPIPAPIPLWVAVIGGFLIISFLPYIAWQAHLGGLVLGLIAGYFFRRKRRYFF